MKKVVVIGGGTGTYTILRGLKKYPLDLTAIVSMMDDGGSTGILRDEYGILPPGDIRKCIIALSESTEIMKDLFQYRFTTGGLKGHNFGNIFITALKEVTGSDELAIKEACKILAIRGNVLPVTLDHARLCAVLENGQVVKGETNIDIPKHDGNLKILKVFLEPKARANKEAVKAILGASLIVLGPGDLYSSILPNLLTEGIPEAIRASKAKKMYICNLMTKFGETNNFHVEDFIREIENYLGKNAISAVMYNTGKIKKNTKEKYAKEKAFLVGWDEQELNKAPYAFITGNFICEQTLIRHDSERVASAIQKYLEPLP